MEIEPNTASGRLDPRARTTRSRRRRVGIAAWGGGRRRLWRPLSSPFCGPVVPMPGTRCQRMTSGRLLPSGETIVGFPLLSSCDAGRTSAPVAASQRSTANPFFLWFSPDGRRRGLSTCHSTRVGSARADDKSYVANADGGAQEVRGFRDGAERLVEGLVPGRHEAALPGAKWRKQRTSATCSSTTSAPVTRRSSPTSTVSQGYSHILAGFSPDGEQVVYDLARPPGIWPSSPTDVWSVPVTGGAPSRLFRDAGHPAYLADGRVAFLRDDADILAAEPGEQPRSLLESDGFLVSPDGTRIAYAVGDDLKVLDTVSGESSDLGKAGDWV